MKFRISEDVNDDEWDSELKRSKWANFFQTSEYIKFESLGEGRTPIFIHILDDEDNHLGQVGLIMQKSTKIFSTNKLIPFANVFSKLGNRASWIGGPNIHDYNDTKKIEILQKIFEAFEFVSKKYDLILIDGYSSPLDKNFDKNFLLEFKRKNFYIKDFFTLISDLNVSIDDIWKHLKKSAQRDIIRAEKRQIRIRELKNLDELDDYFRIKENWLATKGIKSSNITENVKQNYWNYYKKKIEKVFLAYENDELVATHRVGCFNKIAFSHKITNSYLKPTSLGGPLLTWQGLKWAKDSGMKYYDFSGGELPPKNPREVEEYNKQWESLLAYKRKWGGKEYPYYHFFKIMKKKSYKITRALMKTDWKIRNYKKNHFKKT